MSNQRIRPWVKNLFNYFIIPIGVSLFTWIAQNYICNNKLEINITGKIVVAGQESNSLDDISVSISNQDGDKTINGEFELDILTTIPKYSYLGCNTCESSTSKTLQIIYNDEVYFHDFTIHNEAITTSSSDLSNIRIPEDCRKSE